MNKLYPCSFGYVRVVEMVSQQKRNICNGKLAT